MRVALIGTWGHYGAVLSELAGIPGFALTAIASGAPGENPELVRTQRPDAALAVCYDDPLRLLAEQRPELVIVSTRPDRIAAHAIAAAEAGCHTICEKPLAIRHDELRRLWDAVARGGVQSLAMLGNRTHPVLAAARRAVREGRLGEVALLNARKSYRFGQRPEWFGDRARYGGTFPWIGIHALDFVDAVVDSPVRKLSALHANAAHPQFRDCEDVCLLTARLANGVLASVSLDYLRPESAPTHGDDWLRVVGSRGVLEAHMAGGRCSLLASDAPPCELPLEPDQPYYLPVVLGFPPAGSAAPDAATRRGFRLTHAALCARDAADRGSVLTVPPAPWDERA